MSRPSNTVILIGRLTKDIIVNYYGEGDQSRAVARFSLAVDRGRKNAQGQNESDFINCVAFGKTAEFMEKYFGRGSKVAVTGEIHTGKYEKDGQTVYTTDVNVDKADFVESRKSDDAPQTSQNGQNGGYNRQPNNYQQRPANNGYGNPQAFKNQPQQRPPMNNDAYGAGFMEIPGDVNDSGLPFN